MDSEKIRAVHSTLHLIFHRNKNQHGKSKWWKWLSMLKRITLNIARSLEDQPSSCRTGSSADIYRQHLALHILPRCYLAFSTVIADTQFSTLGTVLLSALSRLAKATGIGRDMKARSSRERMVKDNPSRTRLDGEDVGEVVCRTGATPVPVHPAEHNSESIACSAPKSTEDLKMKVLKKRKRRKNAIDDLFDGLL